VPKRKKTRGINTSETSSDITVSPNAVSKIFPVMSVEVYIDIGGFSCLGAPDLYLQRAWHSASVS
jgi:hypothetical protein